MSLQLPLQDALDLEAGIHTPHAHTPVGLGVGLDSLKGPFLGGSCRLGQSRAGTMGILPKVPRAVLSMLSKPWQGLSGQQGPQWVLVLAGSVRPQPPPCAGSLSLGSALQRPHTRGRCGTELMGGREQGTREHLHLRGSFLFTHPSIYPSIHSSTIYLSFHPSTPQLMHSPTHLFIHLSIHPPIHPSTHPPIHPSIH
jgi:hypothetical protein